MIRAIRNQGRPGVASMAIAAVDVSLWDLKAKLLDRPLAALLGRVRTEVPVYGSGGFTSMTDDRLREQMEGWVRDDGIPRVKMKIGSSWGTDEERDLQRWQWSERSSVREPSCSSTPTGPTGASRRFVADHARVDRLLFDGVLAPVGGVLRPDPSRPGLGLELKRPDAEVYRHG